MNETLQIPDTLFSFQEFSSFMVVDSNFFRKRNFQNWKKV